jgi:putative transcriptional regulator
MAFIWPRRSVLWLGVVFASPMLCTAALSKPEEAQPGTSLAGQLLVATREIGDPRFRHTVILMVKHDESGALGIVLNRPVGEVPIAKLLDSLGIDSKGTGGEVRLFAGGPVEPNAGFIVHSADYHRADTIEVDGNAAVTTDPQVLRDIGLHQGPRKSLIAFGYAGWGPKQLEGEIARGGWFTEPEDPKLVFDIDRNKVWDEAMKRHTISL